MNAYVDGYEFDVFVSYAHADDIGFADYTGWVHTFAENLQSLLAQKLGRKTFGKLWIDDRRLSGNQPLGDNIHHAINHTAALVVVYSEAYLQSDWCRQERELFVQTAAGNGSGNGRIFLVRLEDIDPERCPRPFSELLGYPFFRREYPDGPTRRLGFPVVDPRNPEDRQYFILLDDLARDLVGQFQRMAALPPPSAVVADASIVGAAVSTAESSSQQPAILLAESTMDLDDLQDDIRRYLDQLGIRVLPETYYQRSVDAFSQTMNADLSRVQLMVQLLGPLASRRTPDLPRGYEGLQLDLARQAGIPVMRWHDTDLDIATVREPERILEADAMAMPFEDFKREVERQVRIVHARSQQALLPNDDESFVLIKANSRDDALIDSIADSLSAANIGYDVVDESYSLEDLLDQQQDDYNGLMVLYGQCEPTWVQDSIRECRRIMLGRKERAPACAVYIGPPSGKPPLRSRPPRFFFLPHEDLSAFSSFIAALQGGRER